MAAGENSSDLAVAAVQLNGATVRGTGGLNAELSGVVTNPAGVLQVDTTAPTIAINAVAGDDIVDAAEQGQALTISGTTTGAETGRPVTVGLNGQTYAATVHADGSWSVLVPTGDVGALAGGTSYQVTAAVSDEPGRPDPSRVAGAVRGGGALLAGLEAASRAAATERPSARPQEALSLLGRPPLE